VTRLEIGDGQIIVDLAPPPEGEGDADRLADLEA
jgi:hypothetical protein